jgi:preprotein translocase subunit YajC
MTIDLLTIAMAPPGGEGGGQNPMFMFVWLGLMIAIFYVMLIRPQQRRERERRALIDAVKTGDRVVFSGGIIGIVANVKDKLLVIKIADKVKIEVARSAVSQVLEKGEAPEDTEKK